MTIKANFYLNGGVQEVWVVWPKTRTVDVWTAPDTFVTYTDQQPLISAQLPGFASDTRHVFDG